MAKRAAEAECEDAEAKDVFLFDVFMEKVFLLQILKFQFIARFHTLTEHVKRNLKNSSFCLPVLMLRGFH